MPRARGFARFFLVRGVVAGTLALPAFVTLINMSEMQAAENPATLGPRLSVAQLGKGTQIAFRAKGSGSGGA